MVMVSFQIKWNVQVVQWTRENYNKQMKDYDCKKQHHLEEKLHKWESSEMARENETIPKVIRKFW